MRRNRVETYVCDYGKSQQPCFVKGLAMDQQQYIDFVLRTVEERDIRFIRLWFTDVLGRLKSFAISPEDLEVAFEEGIGFDGSAIEGFTTPDEADHAGFPRSLDLPDPALAPYARRRGPHLLRCVHP